MTASGADRRRGGDLGASGRRRADGCDARRRPPCADAGSPPPSRRSRTGWRRRASAAACRRASSGATITADARVDASWRRYLRIGEKRDRAGPGRLERRDARHDDRAVAVERRAGALPPVRRVRMRHGPGGCRRAPATRRGGAAAPRRYLSASALITFSVMSMRWLANTTGILQDEVELLGLGDLLDHLVRALLDARELLVAAQVQVLAELALRALQVARQVGEVALLVAALGLAPSSTPSLSSDACRSRTCFVSFWISASRAANSFSSFCCARFAGAASRNRRSVLTKPIL